MIETRPCRRCCRCIERIPPRYARNRPQLV